MYDAFKGHNKRLVVGTTMTPADSSVFSAAKSFARRTGMTTRLVHVLEPWLGWSATRIFPGEYLAMKIAEVMMEKRLQEAETKMTKVVLSFEREVPVESKVLLGQISDGLIADAIAQKASLIMTGLKPIGRHFLPEGLSTVLQLMSSAKTPVMTIPIDGPFHFDKDHLKILFADDLTEGSRAALGTAVELTLCLAKAEFIHVHVCEQTKEEFTDWAETIERELQRTQLNKVADFSSSEAFAQTNAAIETWLDRRLGFAKLLLTSNGASYCRDIQFGPIRAKLSELIATHNPDILVFGRHAAIHHNPFAIGKLPFFAMLAFGRPVVVVPPHHHRV